MVWLQVDSFRAHQTMGAHRHRRAYAALVVEGAYIEASLDGRFACPAGSVVIHPPFHAHANVFGTASCTVANLPLPDGEADLAGYRITTRSDVAELLRIAARNPHKAGLSALEAASVNAPIAPPVWLAAFLDLILDDWPVASAAGACGVSAAHASRAAARWFGSSPARLRREGRIRRALKALREGAAVCEAAAHAGFADQPHLTRTLKKAIGVTPARFRNG